MRFVLLVLLNFSGPVLLLAQEVTVVAETEENSHSESELITDDSESGDISLSEQVARESGVVLNRMGAPGTASYLWIEGLSPHAVDVYMEGVRVSSSYDRLSNLENLPSGYFGVLEKSSAVLPAHPSAGGEVVALNFRHIPAEKSEFRLLNEADSFATWGQSLSYRDEKQSIALQYRLSANHYDYLDDNGTKYNTDDDSVAIRQNEGYSQAGFTGIFQPLKNLNIFNDIFYKRSGLSGALGESLENVEQESMRAALALTWFDSLSDTLKVRISQGAVFQSKETFDPDDELFAFGSAQQYRTLSSQSAASLEIVPFGLPLILTPGVSLESDYLETASSESGSNEQSLLYTRLLPQATVAWLLPQNFTFTVQTGWLQLFDKSVEEGYLQAGSSLWWKSKHLEWNAEARHSARTPSLAEKYGDGSFVIANEDLESEKHMYYSTRLKFIEKIKSMDETFSVHTYLRDVKDMIVPVQVAPSVVMSRNIGAAQIFGLDLENEISWKETRVSAKYSLSDARDNGDEPAYNGKQLPYIPRHKFYGLVEQGFGRFFFYFSAALTGANFRDRYNSALAYLDRRSILSIGSGYRANHYTLRSRVENLLDEKKSDFSGYPLPGRSYSLSLEVRW